MIEDALADLLRSALASSGLDLDGEPPEIVLTKPKQKEHGDFATNLALQVAGRVGKPPLEVAEIIVANLPVSDVIESKEIARPGFINFRVRDDWLHRALRDVAAQGAMYGRSAPSGRRVQVEFVSANPTGPLTLGHARNAAIGDALARLFEFTGLEVLREYYFNDAGGQMDRFGDSVVARYLQAVGREAEVPQDGYHGAYLADIAEDILRAVGPSLADLPPDERMLRLRDEAVQRVLPQIRSTLDRFGVRFDVYTSERTLAERGEIELAVQRLRQAGLAYEADGAVWFRSTEFGDDKDRVLIRSNGRHTYFAADCAYVIDKFSRGFDHVVYVWGADHHGDVARVRGAAQALGYDPSSLEFVVYQWVAFLRDGEPVPMSKRAGTFVTLDELMDEVGTDAARFHLLMFSPDATMNFDIEAVRQQSMDNPVYYVQYGHARIASILRKAAERRVELRSIDEVDLWRLSHEAELDLLRAIADVERQIRTAAERRAPHRLTHAAQDIAGRFHRFYTECSVLSDDAALTQARLWLCVGTKQVIANLLELLGVSAPESMERSEDVERAR
ncbi:MAG TPA: arginine--tRNA ligase [Actinomycetota bacterium]|jgi:arginyl-tRNA synthetase|nr:arginine--tRNA ligase [Actinomycetota bacterium]